MRLKTVIVLLIMLFCSLGTAQAQETVKVAVFSFDVFASQSLDTLKQQMQDMLRTRLSKLGLEVIDPGEVNKALIRSGKVLDLSLARSLAGELGADFAIYGSLTKIGSRVSLDVKVLDSLGMTRPSTSYVEGVGLDSLPQLADQIAQDVLVKVTGQEKVAEVLVEGNRGIESAAVTSVIKTKAGNAYSPLVLDGDIRAVWKMGYFDDVQVTTKDSAKGKIVTFQVTGKTCVKGNKCYRQ
jgi:outer membrane protein insertion porin family